MTKTFILTSMQNNTAVHAPLWANLRAYAEHRGAEIMVARYRYDTRFHGRSAKPGTADDEEEVWFDPAVPEEMICDRSVKLTRSLVWCGEVQILPTAKRPISGFESYTARASCILPHAKFAMTSIASGKHEGTKLIFTTGTVTRSNYIQKKAGLLAQFHHGLGALIVEIADTGEWFVRQLNADARGNFRDLDVSISGGKVTAGKRVEAIVWGDFHARRHDPAVSMAAWGESGMLETLRPRVQVFHDLLDFRARNHHEIGSGHARFERFMAKDRAEDDVGAEVREAANALVERSRRWCKSVVVASNHDAALLRWLDTADYRADVKNALYFLALQTMVYEGIANRLDVPIFERAMYRANYKTVHARFLKEDESFLVCERFAGGVELGMHGHRGVNGARGSPVSLARMGRKAVIGHSHSAGIVDGVYSTGTSSLLDLGYNVGPSSWTHSHVVVYPNGKRAVVTMWKGKWRA